MKVLFLAPRFPYPPLKGDQVRSWNQLRILAERHDITFACFAEETVSQSDRQAVEAICRKIVDIPLPRAQKILNLARGIWDRRPFQSLLYASARMRRMVEEHRKQGDFDLVHVQLARMAPYVERMHGLPRVIDFIDSLSLNMRRRESTENSLVRTLVGIERRRLERFESAIAATFERGAIVSEVDWAELGSPGNVEIVPNGVDLSPAPYSGRKPGKVVFSGNMAYDPNVRAAIWFSHEVWPLIKRRVPWAQFVIAGTNPPPRVVALNEKDPTIRVTGFVPDLRQWMQRASVAVAPMRSGSGIQNKVVEAMACGTPVVATPFALGGLRARTGRDLIVEEDATSFADAVCRLLENGENAAEMGARGLEMVRDHHSWERSATAIEELWHRALADRAG